MQGTIPAQMRAAAIDRYGGPEVLHAETLPVPRPGPAQVLLRLASDATRTGLMSLVSTADNLPSSSWVKMRRTQSQQI